HTNGLTRNNRPSSATKAAPKAAASKALNRRSSSVQPLTNSAPLRWDKSLAESPPSQVRFNHSIIQTGDEVIYERTNKWMSIELTIKPAVRRNSSQNAGESRVGGFHLLAVAQIV